eukprot:TRINITY_DN41764_c0_g1_i1.p1 TRINITY_DN41764_c0_g1~~TRINITY_DN41764_c0_g1_i1.p1  ORF type:complete len:188 (+),score=42.40 TRINITY_DN41764_c0_g1_i1:68-631(+)
MSSPGVAHVPYSRVLVLYAVVVCCRSDNSDKPSQEMPPPGGGQPDDPEKGTEASGYDTHFDHGQHSCAGEWQQCGGSTHWFPSFTGRYAGNKTCCEPFVCNTTAGWWGFPYWKQCVPADMPFVPGKKTMGPPQNLSEEEPAHSLWANKFLAMVSAAACFSLVLVLVGQRRRLVNEDDAYFRLRAAEL